MLSLREEREQRIVAVVEPERVFVFPFQEDAK